MVFSLKPDLRLNNVMQVRSMYTNSAEVQNISEMERQNPDHIWGNDVSKGSSNVFFLFSLCFLFLLILLTTLYSFPRGSSFC